MRNYVLDTNVLLHDPNALNAFEDHNVVVPVYVFEEIDNFKKHQDELGRNARTVSRMMDKYRKMGSLKNGVKLESGGMLRVLFADGDIPNDLKTMSIQDDKILAVAWHLSKAEPSLETVFITMDTNLRIRADALEIRAEDYEKGHVRPVEMYKGYGDVSLPASTIEQLTREGRIDLPPTGTFYANMLLTVTDPNDPNWNALGRVSRDKKSILHIREADAKRSVWGIRARNKEQIFAMNLLLDDSIKLVTLVGKAGTGKTLVAVACGLNKVTDEQLYDRILVSRPVFPMGRDIGFLPGTIEEKLNPWMQPIYDSIDFLLTTNKKERKGGAGGVSAIQGLKDMGILQIEPLTYIRGRSIPNQFLIVDEAQNLTPHEVKTILTRAGEGTKVVLTGDPYQIDNPYLDSLSNGLTYTLVRFRDSPIAGTMTLEKGERSELAEMAANLL